MSFKGWASVVTQGDVAQAISKKAQRPLRRNAWVKLANRTSGCVARVDERFFALHALRNFGALPLIKRFKIITAHIDFATHFQHCGRILGQPQGNLFDGADVLRDVFTRFTIAARGRLHQHAAFIAQAHRQPVKFEFTHVFNWWITLCQTQLFANADVKVLRARGFSIGFCANAEHGHFVTHAGKLVKGFAANTLGRRISSQ